jgi:hypothetical protein
LIYYLFHDKVIFIINLREECDFLKFKIGFISAILLLLTLGVNTHAYGPLDEMGANFVERAQSTNNADLPEIRSQNCYLTEQLSGAGIENYLVYVPEYPNLPKDSLKSAIVYRDPGGDWFVADLKLASTFPFDASTKFKIPLTNYIYLTQNNENGDFGFYVEQDGKFIDFRDFMLNKYELEFIGLTQRFNPGPPKAYTDNISKRKIRFMHQQGKTSLHTIPPDQLAKLYTSLYQQDFMDDDIAVHYFEEKFKKLGISCHSTVILTEGECALTHNVLLYQQKGQWCVLSYGPAEWAKPEHAPKFFGMPLTAYAAKLSDNSISEYYADGANLSLRAIAAIGIRESNGCYVDFRETFLFRECPGLERFVLWYFLGDKYTAGQGFTRINYANLKHAQGKSNALAIRNGMSALDFEEFVLYAYWQEEGPEKFIESCQSFSPDMKNSFDRLFSKGYFLELKERLERSTLV